MLESRPVVSPVLPIVSLPVPCIVLVSEPVPVPLFNVLIVSVPADAVSDDCEVLPELLQLNDANAINAIHSARPIVLFFKMTERSVNDKSFATRSHQ